MSSRGLGRALLATLFLHLMASPVLAECARWPDEPQPLPSVRDADPLRARWAELRSREIANLAADRESEAPVSAYRLWNRILCLDPTNVAARRGAARTFPIAIHRPAVSVVEGAAPEHHSWARDPWEELGQGLIVYVEPPSLPPPPDLPEIEASLHVLDLVEPEPQLEVEPQTEREEIRAPEPEINWAALAAERARALADLEEQLDQAEDALRTARFRFGLAGIDAARLALDDLEPADDLNPLRVRLESLAATAHVALGQRDLAQRSLSRALAVDPDFTLDPQKTSPKILLALRLARASQSRRPEAK